MVKGKSLKLICSALLVATAALSAVAVGSTVTPKTASAANYNPQRIGLSYSYPTTYSDWANAFLAGNGKMGIMVFGNPLNDTIVYNDRGFNLAKSKDRTFNQISAADLNSIKNNAAAGNFAAANQLAASAPGWSDGGEGNRHPGYEMLINIPASGTVTNYSRTTDFRTGEITVNWTDNRGTWQRKSFVSRQDDVIVQYLPKPTNGTITASIQLSTDPGMAFPAGMTFTNASATDYLNMRVNYPSNTNGAGYEGVTRVITSGGTKSMNGNVLNITGADSVMLLTRTAKYYSDSANQWNQKKLQSQLAAISTDYNTLLNGQKATHQTIYDRVKLDLNASAADRAKSNEELLAMQKASSTPVKALWERVFDSGRYYYLSSSSSQTPPDLLGIWTGDCNAGWGGYYHMDANLNLQISGGNIGDMPEAMAGYFALNEAWKTDFQTNAQKLLGVRGMLAAGNSPGPTSGLMAAINTYYPYQYATGEEAWLLYPFWEHYLITGDTTFLRDHLYPLLKEMGYFYEDFLTKTDSNGKYIFAGSVSPENQPSNLAVSLVNNSTFDIAGAKFALTTLIQAANTLGLDQGAGQGVEKWTNILNKLPPYLINADGALQEWSWPGLNDTYNHRHSSHLVNVWPYREITPESNPTLFNAASTTLEMKDAYSYENAGHGILHSALIAANLKNAQSVYGKLMRLTKEDFYYNSLATSHYTNHGVFATDVANTMPGIMMEMLVSSSPGTLELLPALPQQLDKGAISGVKGRNRVTVQELSWDLTTNTLNATVKSDINQSITLIQRRGIDSITSSAPVSASPLGPTARVLQLQAGVSTTISIGMGQLGPVNLALNKPVTVSSTSDNSTGANAVDGNTGTRWSSGYTDNEWIAVDLGSTYNLTGVKLSWEAAYGKSYKIQVSGDGSNWTDAYSTTTGNGGSDQINFTASGRYVRMLGVQRATAFGYSLWEFEVKGTPGGGGGSGNAALNKPASVSSVSDNTVGASAFDGNANTRWSSGYTNNEWISVDLGSTYNLTGAKLSWEAAYGKSYKIQVSSNGTSWTDVYSTTTGDGGTDQLNFTASGRYVRMQGVQRATAYGFSLWEFEVYGSVAQSSSNLALNRPVTVTSVADNTQGASAVDGNGATRWSSGYTDNESLTVDLGAVKSLTGAKLTWEAAYGKSYKIQVSSNGTSWTDVYATTTGDGGVDQLSFAASGRYVRMLGTQRATQYGFSLWEFEVYGS
ncbi:glycosyl hydrolase family 95 catalytic domain-containing protein [Cohnella yongneupensis]|uniref:Discoidin domain-containing protein n=1 Tax=Cohnella yongneupensis TaxID=425006 RepID=A0ABW0QVT7_9BACL